jgi:hypothetical protein
MRLLWDQMREYLQEDFRYEQSPVHLALGESVGHVKAGGGGKQSTTQRQPSTIYELLTAPS